MTLRARVHAGRLTLDEPTELPDGAEVDLVPLDPGDDLDDTERAALHAALDRSAEQAARGELHDADEVLADLDRQPGR